MSIPPRRAFSTSCSWAIRELRSVRGSGRSPGLATDCGAAGNRAEMRPNSTHPMQHTANEAPLSCVFSCDFQVLSCKLRAVAVNTEVLAIILGGGQGTRLFPLTQQRSKPAVPIGGKYRLIDVPISNCLHADVRRIFVLTQFNSASLNRHVGQTYRMDVFNQGFVEILAAEQTPDNPHWYQGTADAVRQAARHIARHESDYYLVLAGDQ